MKMPWWLLLLRLLLATALILAVARPLLNPQADLPGKGPLMLVIDDGWSSAPGWTTRIAHAERLIQRAERAQPPGRADRHRARAARCAGDAQGRHAARRGAHASCAPSGPSPGRPTAPPPSPTIDQMQVDPARLCHVAERRPGRRRRGQAHRTPAPLRRAAGHRARPGDHAAAAAAARRRRPRPQGAGAAARRRRPAQGRHPGGRRAGPRGGAHRSRLRRHRDQGRRHAAGAAGAAQPHGAARHRGAGRRGQHGAARRALAPPAGLHPGRARRPPAASR